WEFQGDRSLGARRPAAAGVDAHARAVSVRDAPSVLRGPRRRDAAAPIGRVFTLRQHVSPLITPAQHTNIDVGGLSIPASTWLATRCAIACGRTFMFRKIYRVLTVFAVVAAASGLLASGADARIGGGFSSGSRGSRTFSAPPSTSTTPSTSTMQR